MRANNAKNCRRETSKTTPDFASSFVDTPALHATHSTQGMPQKRTSESKEQDINNMKEKVMGAVKTFLECKGYEVVDEVAITVVRDNRALLHHHINCICEMEPFSSAAYPVPVARGWAFLEVWPLYHESVYIRMYSWCTPPVGQIRTDLSDAPIIVVRPRYRRRTPCAR